MTVLATVLTAAVALVAGVALGVWVARTRVPPATAAGRAPDPAG